MAAFKVVGFLLFAASYGSVTRGPVLDNIIRDLLEKSRPKVKDLEIPPQSFNLTDNLYNISVDFDRGLVRGLDKFVLTKLSTTLIPLKVTNLTLTLDEVEVTGVYDVNGIMVLPGLPGNLTVFGKGNARIVLKGIFFTIAADFAITGGKLQIPPKGLRGFDICLSRSEVRLDNLLGDEELGKVINAFLGFFMPDVVRDYKQIFFETVRDPLIKLINEALAEQKPPH